jgi:hypothetical protein
MNWDFARMQEFKKVLLLAIAMTGLACTGSGEYRAESDAASPEAKQPGKGPVTLAFFDSRIFDEELSNSMSNEPRQVTVNVPAGFHLNEIPERFDRWLYSVKRGGGKVVAKPENPSRGLVSAAIDVVVSVAGKIDEMRLYRPSQQYDATLLYREDGAVSKVVFDRR